MKLKSLPLVVCLLGGAMVAQDVTAGQAPGSSQPAPASVRRPYRGIFGAPADPVSKQSLDFSASLFGAYDDDVYSGESGGGVYGYGKSGAFAGASAGLAYAKRGDRVGGALSGSAGLNRYFENTIDQSEYYQVGAAINAALSRALRLTANQMLSYSPQYFLGPVLPALDSTPVGDQLVPTHIDVGLFDQRAYRSVTAVQLSRAVGRHSSIEASYALGLVVRSGSTGQSDYRSDSADVAFIKQLTTHASLRAGYGYQTAGYLDTRVGARQHLHSVDLGIDYGRALSISRRTHFGFSSGSAIWSRGEREPLSNQHLSLRLIGSAHLEHEIGRTWTARLEYDRGLAFYEGFTDPFLTDGISTDLHGFITRRMRFGSAATYSIGTVGTGANRGFNSTSANAGLEFGLTRSLALFARYVYYRYDFDANSSIDPRLLRTFDRQGVRAGLNVSVPVIR